MRIRQVRVASALKLFSKRFMSKYDLHAYTNPHKPAIFFGCYPGRGDINAVLHHSALAVIVWGGSDAKSMHRAMYSNMLAAPNICHVAISKFVSNDMLKLKVPHIHLPVCPSIHQDFEPAPLGQNVYVYSSHLYPKNYGWDLVRKVQRLLPHVKFSVRYSTPPGSCPIDEMTRVYKRCFIGLRLTTHDGLSNTVVELGLMGRRCVWNGWTPNAIPWTSVDDVVRIIKEEQSRIGELHPEVACEIKEFLHLNDDWLHTEFYE